jgi:hypothetical protein
VLGYLCHAPLRRDEKITAVFADAAIEQGEQAGLACTVTADKADGLSRLMVVLTWSSRTLVPRAA